MQKAEVEEKKTTDKDNNGGGGVKFSSTLEVIQVANTASILHINQDETSTDDLEIEAM